MKIFFAFVALLCIGLYFGSVWILLGILVALVAAVEISDNHHDK